MSVLSIMVVVMKSVSILMVVIHVNVTVDYGYYLTRNLVDVSERVFIVFS